MNNDSLEYFVLVKNKHRLSFQVNRETQTVHIASMNSLGIQCSFFHVEKWYGSYNTFVLASAKTLWLEKVEEGYRMENIKPCDLTIHQNYCNIPT